MSNPVQISCNYTNTTSTKTIYTGPCAIYGIWVSSASNTPTLKVSDGANVVANTFTPAGATFYQIPASIATSLIVTVSGTVDCTVMWNSSF